MQTEDMESGGDLMDYKRITKNDIKLVFQIVTKSILIYKNLIYNLYKHIHQQNDCIHIDKCIHKDS